MDFTRIVITLLLPVSFISSLLLMAMGAPQTLESSFTVNTLEGRRTDNNHGSCCIIRIYKRTWQQWGGFLDQILVTHSKIQMD